MALHKHTIAQRKRIRSISRGVKKATVPKRIKRKLLRRR